MGGARPPDGASRMAKDPPKRRHTDAAVDTSPARELLARCWLSPEGAAGVAERLRRGRVTDLELRDLRTTASAWSTLGAAIQAAPELTTVCISHCCVPSSVLSTLGDWAHPQDAIADRRSLVLGGGVIAVPGCLALPDRAAGCLAAEAAKALEEVRMEPAISSVPVEDRWDAAAERLRSVRDRVLRLEHAGWADVSPTATLGPSGLTLYQNAASVGLSDEERAHVSLNVQNWVAEVLDERDPELLGREELEIIAANAERLIATKARDFVREEHMLRRASDRGEAQLRRKASLLAGAIEEVVCIAAGIPVPVPAAARLRLMCSLVADSRTPAGSRDVPLYQIASAVDVALRPLLRRLSVTTDAQEKSVSPPPRRRASRERPRQQRRRSEGGRGERRERVGQQDGGRSPSQSPGTPSPQSSVDSDAFVDAPDSPAGPPAVPAPTGGAAAAETRTSSGAGRAGDPPSHLLSGDLMKLRERVMHGHAQAPAPAGAMTKSDSPPRPPSASMKTASPRAQVRLPPPPAVGEAGTPRPLGTTMRKTISTRGSQGHPSPAPLQGSSWGGKPAGTQKSAAALPQSQIPPPLAVGSAYPPAPTGPAKGAPAKHAHAPQFHQPHQQYAQQQHRQPQQYPQQQPHHQYPHAQPQQFQQPQPQHHHQQQQPQYTQPQQQQQGRPVRQKIPRPRLDQQQQPAQRPALRFRVGTRVLCTTGQSPNDPGTVVRQWEDDKPYRVSLDRGGDVMVPADNDRLVRLLQ
eukprot:TRINITY_DN4261_c2_g2_i1.p1 TRINITY_DN4261_c2_g2~~TRINITY_DN4261_c2_g2_i1.p1  ORF type:complete len:749 (+),score=102.94 TRINITY_DN4261_c2_g2_i1:68-2314(+)